MNSVLSQCIIALSYHLILINHGKRSIHYANTPFNLDDFQARRCQLLNSETPDIRLQDPIPSPFRSIFGSPSRPDRLCKGHNAG